MTRTKRTLVFAAVFWSVALGLLSIDWATSSPHSRYDEPPPWQLGQQRVEGAGHCAEPLK